MGLRAFAWSPLAFEGFDAHRRKALRVFNTAVYDCEFLLKEDDARAHRSLSRAWRCKVHSSIISFSRQVVLFAAVLAIAGCGGSNSAIVTTKTTPVITWATPASIVAGTALSTKQLDATADVAGSFVYSPAVGTVESTAGTVTLSVTFTPTDTTDYDSATASVTLTVAKKTPTITWAAPAPILAGTALSATQLDANADVPGAFVYSPVAGTVESTAGTVTLSTTFTPTDTTTYSTATASVSLIVTAVASMATVDFGTAEQAIRGFGGAYPWAPSTMPSATISALFGTTGTDLGLSILRLHIAPATWDSTNKTADTSAWTTELSNGVLAQQAGATVFASPWSAPASMKTNGSVNEGSLSTSSYADYAAYLKAYVNYAASQGVNLYAVSLQNEPDWNPCDPSGTDEGPTGKDCYESCLWTAAQFDAWIAGNGSVLTTGTNPVKLMMPESYSFSSAMSDTALDDSAAEPYISIIGGHLYGSAPYYYTKAKDKGKEVWMTEHYLSPISGSTPEIADAIALAEELHNSITVGQYNAYVWWGSSATNPYSAALIDDSNNPNYFGYAMAQFARFVRPGYVRVDAPATPATGVYLSAYSGSDSSGNSHFVIVAINSNTYATALPISIENATVTSLTPYQTTASGGLAAQSAVTVPGGAFTATLPAQSITTFVQ
jgi:glucuronoarabinoxylan endo-1,4-beta-xylanase